MLFYKKTHCKSVFPCFSTHNLYMTFYRLQIKHGLLYWQEEPCNLLKRQGRDSFRVYYLTDFISSHAITLSHQRVFCQLRFLVDPLAAHLILATIQEACQAWSVINSPRAHTHTHKSKCFTPDTQQLYKTLDFF